MEDRIIVRVLQHKGTAYVVEYQKDGYLHRSAALISDLEFSQDRKSASITVEALDMAIPYGIPWECLIRDHLISGEIIADCLRRAGIWTYEDFAKNSQGIVAAIRDATRPILREINSILRERKP